MRRHSRLAAISAIGTVALASALAACGGNDKSTTTSAPNETSDAVRGGTLNMLGISDVDYMDPNISYYSLGYLAHRNWSRQLFSYPGVAGEKDGRLAAEETVPDLATEIPTVAN